MTTRPSRSRTATLADVARRAGVSKATASKALNGRPDIGEETRVRVVAVAEELAFSPNPLARSLMSGRSQSVGLLTDDQEGRFALPIMMGAEDALGEAETVALLTSSRGRPDLERGHHQALLARRVDGIIIVGKAPEPRPSLQDASTVATVYAYAASTSPLDVSVLADHHGAGRLATEHLLALGRRRIAHIAGPFGSGVGHTAAELRAQGVMETLAEHGLAAAGGPPASGDWTEQWGWDAANRLLDEHRIDGLVCGNDQIARGAIDRLVTRGVAVPQQVAVVGFDDAVQLVQHGRLPQTSVDMRLYEVGRAAARAVLEPGYLAQGHHLIAGRLIARASTTERGTRQ